MDARATTQISKLRQMNLKQLHEQYRELFKAPCKSNNREWVFKTVARKLQNDEEPESAKRPVSLPALIAKHAKKPHTQPAGKEIAPQKSAKRAKAGERDPRLPKVGSTIEREYHGKVIKVAVNEDGFTWSGKHFGSLSKLATEITGGIINGFAFFKLNAKS